MVKVRKLMPLTPAVFVNGEKGYSSPLTLFHLSSSGDQQSEAKMFSNTRVARQNSFLLHRRSLLVHAKAQDSC